MAVPTLDLTAGEAMEDRQESVRRLLPLSRQAYQLAARVLRSASAAEDAVQQAFLNALRSMPLGLPPEEARLWFLRVTGDAARKILRSELRRKRREAAVVQEARQADAGTIPDDQEIAVLRGALEALDEKYRLPVALCYEQGLNQREAAAVLRMPERTVSKYVQVGLERLRQSLERAGYAAAPAVVLGALAHTAPPVPATLAAAIQNVLANQAVGAGADAATVSAAAKGGLTMKIIVGVVLAGALAGGAALFFGPATGNRQPATTLASPPAAQPEPLKGPPQSTHYALAAYWDYLDGPRLEAMAMCHRSGVCDDQDNLYFVTAFGLSTLRCVRANGMVETITGDDRPLNDLGLAEGPAAFLPKLSAPGGFGSVALWMSVRGAPFEGEEKGAVYVGATNGPAYRVFRNKAQGGRWWFKQLSFGEMKKPFTVTVESDGSSLGVLCDGSYYRYDDQKGTVALLLNAADYKDRWDDKGLRWPLKGQVADNAVRAEDGTFYLSSWRCRTGMYRLSPDKSRFEMIIHTRGNSNGPRSPVFDGSGMTADFFDGPSLCGYRPPHTLFVSGVDDGILRRWRDGRISTWDPDGEWRESTKIHGNAGRQAWFYGWSMGPRGANYVYNHYSGQCRQGDDRIFKVGPIDFDKPTVGPLVEGK